MHVVQFSAVVDFSTRGVDFSMSGDFQYMLWGSLQLRTVAHGVE